MFNLKQPSYDEKLKRRILQTKELISEYEIALSQEKAKLQTLIKVQKEYGKNDTERVVPAKPVSNIRDTPLPSGLAIGLNGLSRDEFSSRNSISR